MKTFFLALLMSLLAFSTAMAAGDEEAIQKRLDEFVAAWNNHDAEAMAALWAPDGDLINPFGRVAKGRPEVEKLFIDEHASFTKGTTYKVTSSLVRVLGSEVAVLAGGRILQQRVGLSARSHVYENAGVMILENDTKIDYF